MPVYEYVAFNRKGKSVKGVTDAESAFAARRRLRQEQLFPVTLKETKEAPAGGTRAASLPLTFGRVKSSEIVLMTRQLATLTAAGFPLVGAFDSLISIVKSHTFKRMLTRLKDAIVEGRSFADSLALFPRAFPPLYVNMVRAGETSGTLELVLERLAEIGEKQQDTLSKIRTALAYPILMAFTGTAVLFFLLTYIVPRITSIFDEMNQALPVPTVLLIGLSHFINRYWWAFAVAAALLAAGLWQFKKTKGGRRVFDGFKLSLPGFGPLVKRLAVARFSRTLGSLLENGVPLTGALEIVKNVVGNVVIAEAVENAADAVHKGKDLAGSLVDSGVFPDLSIQMIQVGEQTGKLEPMLMKVADVFEKEVESAVVTLTGLLEPVMILVMGVAVGFVVLSICLPIFEMNQLVG